MDDGWTLLEVFTSERVHHHGVPLHDGVVKAVHDAGVGARCLVFKAIGGAFPDGTVVSHHVLDLATDLPVKVEILVPSAAAPGLIERLRPLVADQPLLVSERRPA